MDSLDSAPGKPVPSPQGLVWRCPQLPSSRFCSGCGHTLSQLRHSSRVGCGICYEAFRDVLRAGIHQLQGTVEHGQPRPALAGPRPAAAGRNESPGQDWLERLFGPEALDWLSGLGPEADVALSSRLRLARNLNRHPFPEAATPATLQAVFAAVETALQAHPNSWTVVAPPRLGTAETGLLRERHLLDSGQALAAKGGGAGLSLVINDEDHLRLQSLRSGLGLSRSLPEILDLAAQLEPSLQFAASPELGYLTACPSNLGTGLRASVLLHLPALAWFEALPEVLRKVARVGGLTLRGLHGEESPVQSPFLQLSNQITMGRAETDLTNAVESVARSLVDSERRARANLLASHRAELEDAVWRARGLLTHARLLSADEAVELLGMLRLGCLCDLLPEPSGARLALRLLIETGDAHLAWRCGQPLSPRQLEAARADLLREALR